MGSSPKHTIYYSFYLIETVFKIGQKLLDVWATFVRKFNTKTLQKLQELVTLIRTGRADVIKQVDAINKF